MLPQILLELVIVRHDSIAHQPTGKTGFKLSLGLPLLLLLLFPKESPEGLEFALLSPVCWEINKAEKTNNNKWINDADKCIWLDDQSQPLQPLIRMGAVAVTRISARTCDKIMKCNRLRVRTWFIEKGWEWEENLSSFVYTDLHLQEVKEINNEYK